MPPPVQWEQAVVPLGLGRLAFRQGGDRDAWSAAVAAGASAGDGAAPRGARTCSTAAEAPGWTARRGNASQTCGEERGCRGGARGPPCAGAATRASLSSSEAGAQARWEGRARGDQPGQHHGACYSWAHAPHVHNRAPRAGHAELSPSELGAPRIYPLASCAPSRPSGGEAGPRCQDAGGRPCLLPTACSQGPMRGQQDPAHRVSVMTLSASGALFTSVRHHTERMFGGGHVLPRGPDPAALGSTQEGGHGLPLSAGTRPALLCVWRVHTGLTPFRCPGE